MGGGFPLEPQNLEAMDVAPGEDGERYKVNEIMKDLVSARKAWWWERQGTVHLQPPAACTTEEDAFHATLAVLSGTNAKLPGSKRDSIFATQVALAARHSKSRISDSPKSPLRSGTALGADVGDGETYVPRVLGNLRSLERQASVESSHSSLDSSSSSEDSQTFVEKFRKQQEAEDIWATLNSSIGGDEVVEDAPSDSMSDLNSEPLKSEPFAADEEMPKVSEKSVPSSLSEIASEPATP